MTPPPRRDLRPEAGADQRPSGFRFLTGVRAARARLAEHIDRSPAVQPILFDTGPAVYIANTGQPVFRPCRLWRTGPAEAMAIVTETDEPTMSIETAAGQIRDNLEAHLRPYGITRVRIVEHWPPNTGALAVERYAEQYRDAAGVMLWRPVTADQLRAVLGAELDSTKPTGPVLNGFWPMAGRSYWEPPNDPAGHGTNVLSHADVEKVLDAARDEPAPIRRFLADALLHGRKTPPAGGTVTGTTEGNTPVTYPDAVAALMIGEDNLLTLAITDAFDRHHGDVHAVVACESLRYCWAGMTPETRLHRLKTAAWAAPAPVLGAPYPADSTAAMYAAELHAGAMQYAATHPGTGLDGWLADRTTPAHLVASSLAFDRDDLDESRTVAVYLTALARQEQPR